MFKGIFERFVDCTFAILAISAVLGSESDALEGVALAAPQAEEGEKAAPLDPALGEVTCLDAVAGMYCGDDMISGGSPETLYHCPGGADQPAVVVKVCKAGCHIAPSGEHDFCEAEVDACSSAGNCNNCVYFARCKHSGLPYGLWTYADKLAIINLDMPEVGAVAVINVGDDVGHVAYVESVDGSTITISEGNYHLGSCGQRTGTMESLKIAGFFK